MNTGTKATLIAHVTQCVQEAAGIWERMQAKQAVQWALPAFHSVHAKCRNLVRMLGPAGEAWKPAFEFEPPALFDAYGPAMSRLKGGLDALLGAMQQDLLVRVEDMVMADAFDDLLEQADHLLSQKYALAAAVLGRAVLEEHLRKVCQRHNCMPTEAKPTLAHFNTALYKHQRMDKLAMKQIEALAEVGNLAAHNLPGFRPEIVPQFLADVRQFILANRLS